MCLVVSHSNSTSNHNGHANEYIFAVLFLIPILHQTTTAHSVFPIGWLLFLIPILHQTTTGRYARAKLSCCFSFQFYIKPQQRHIRIGRRCRCFSFQFYIKPQPEQPVLRLLSVVSHSNSTSNHNVKRTRSMRFWLFLIPILHQTTTGTRGRTTARALFLIPSLHQTTTSRRAVIHILHVTHMTPMHKTSCRTPGKLVGCNFVFQRAIYQKNSSC